jgi:hypothetical protein
LQGVCGGLRVRVDAMMEVVANAVLAGLESACQADLRD